MAIANLLIDGTNQSIVTVPARKQYAILTLVVCNTLAEDPTGANDKLFDLYIVPAVASPIGGIHRLVPQTQIAKAVKVAGSDTFTFDTEKMVLGAGDPQFLSPKC